MSRYDKRRARFGRDMRLHMRMARRLGGNYGKWVRLDRRWWRAWQPSTAPRRAQED